MRFLSYPQVMERTGLSRVTIWRLIGRGDFPKPRPLSTRRVGFVEAEVDSWSRARASFERTASR